jgi:integrase
MKYLFWRGRSLWCRYPHPDRPETYPLKIKRANDTEKEIARCLKEGERALAAIRTRAVEKKFFDIQKPVEPEDPPFCVLALEYWSYKLRYKKSGANERFHLAHSVKRFGPYPVSTITDKAIRLWIADMSAAGASTNTVNNRITYFKAALNHAKSDLGRVIAFDFRIVDQIEKLRGGNVRQFVLTEDRFERNHEFLEKRSPEFARFYLALWETGRRPEEVARYTWRMLDTSRQELAIPADINKKGLAQTIPISDRLFWSVINTTPGHKRDGYLFKNRYGRPWLNFELWATRLKDAFGDDGGWIRDCRRGFVTHKTEEIGADESQVMELTGHVTSSTFRRYRIHKPENLRAIINCTNRANFVQLAEKCSN